MARHASLADYYRAHREAFQLAQELHCTPKEAEAVLAGRAARARWEETSRRLAAKLAAPLPRAAVSEDSERSEPWMMRD